MSRGRHKQRVYSLLYRTRLHAVFGRLKRAAGAIVMLHRVVEHPDRAAFRPTAQFEVSPAVLELLIIGLRAAGFELVSLDEAHARLTAGTPGRFACLTFDDGYRDNSEIAYPICARHDVPIATYVATGFIDGTDPIWWYGLETLIGSHGRVELRAGDRPLCFETQTAKDKAHAFAALGRVFQGAPRGVRRELLAGMRDDYGIDVERQSADLAMGWHMLEEFDRRPGVTIGAHTVSHPALSRLSEPDAREEIAASRAVLEQRLGHPVVHFAYPYGDPKTTGGREFDLCSDLGFKTATTTRHGLVTPRDRDRLLELPRIPTDPFETRETLAVKLSGLPAALQAMRKSRRQRG